MLRNLQYLKQIFLNCSKINIVPCLELGVTAMTKLSQKKLFVFDMDGTIYLGNRVFDEALHLIKRLRESGRRVLFFTNNASHTDSFYLDKLKRLRFEPQKDEIMTSGDVTLEFLKKFRAGKSVYLLGTPELEQDFKSNGVALTDGLSGDVVISSFDTTLTYEKLSRACRLIMGGAEFLSTHPDFNCPTEDGFIPDSGAISAFITASTGVTPRYFGKPYPETMDMICSYTGVNKDDIAVVGDRLYTDVAIGKKSDVTAVLVLTGETKIEDTAGLSQEEMPDLILDDAKHLEKVIFGN